MSEAKLAFLFGAGASNTTGLRLILTAGGDPQKFIMFDTKGGLHKNRLDVKADTLQLLEVGGVYECQPSLH